MRHYIDFYLISLRTFMGTDFIVYFIIDKLVKPIIPKHNSYNNQKNNWIQKYKTFIIICKSQIMFICFWQTVMTEKQLIEQQLQPAVFNRSKNDINCVGTKRNTPVNNCHCICSCIKPNLNHSFIRSYLLLV